MKFLERSVWVSGIAVICFSSTALANNSAEPTLALDELTDRAVIFNTLKATQQPAMNSSSPLFVQEAAKLLVQLEYTPSLERRQTNLSELAEQRQASHLKGAKELEALLSSSQIIDVVQQTIEPFGLKINNLADVYTLWWLTAWQASEGRTVYVSKQTAQAVKQQAVKIWLANPQLAQATDTHKQALAEALLIQALLTQAAMSRAGQDQGSQAAVRTAVRQGAAASGLALERMQLTEQGFVLKPD